MPCPRYTTRTRPPKKWRIFDDFGLRSPVIQKLLRKKTAASTVARVEALTPNRRDLT